MFSGSMSPHPAVRPLVLEARRREARERDGDARRLPAPILSGLLARDGGAHDVRPEKPHGLRRKTPGEPADQGVTAPVVVALEREAREDLPTQPARRHPVAAPADAVNDVRPPTESPEDRQA